MPIIGLQAQMRELGRIRIGQQVASGGGRKHPAKLDTFRITAEVKELVEAAAAEFGGVVTPWRNGDHDEWEVVTTASVMEIIVPPGYPLSQWNELWSGGGCLRRCDNATEWLTDTPCGVQPTVIPGRNNQPDRVIPPCPQEPEERNAAAKEGLACKMTTRLNVILPQLPDLGVWRLESHGYYAAVELAGAANVLAMARNTGQLIPARLRLEQREKKVPGKATYKYAVPIIEFVDTRMIDLQLTARAAAAETRQLGPGAPQIDRPSRPPLPPGTPPPTSDFRAPLPADPAPAAGGTDEESQPITEPSGDVPAAEPTAMTREELVAKLEEAGISLDYAIEFSRGLFPERGPGVPLTPAQLAELWAELKKEAALAAL